MGKRQGGGHKVGIFSPIAADGLLHSLQQTSSVCM